MNKERRGHNEFSLRLRSQQPLQGKEKRNQPGSCYEMWRLPERDDYREKIKRENYLSVIRE